MKTRVISAAVMIAVVAVCMIASPYTRLLLMLAAAVLACREMGNLMKKKGLNAVSVIPCGYAFVSIALAAFGMSFEIGDIWFKAVLALSAACAIFAGIASRKVSGEGSMATLMMLVYPALPFVMIARIAVMDCYIPVFVTGALATWICDSFCLFGGKLFGKHKMSPYVSPNKTWEGTFSGAIFSVISGLIVYFILRSAYDIPLWIYLVTSLIASSMGQIGDLAASLFKRMAGVKDYSNLIPGHGGMMDRADSLLFSIPTTYICFLIAGVI